MEWIISILSSVLSFFLPLWRKKDIVLIVKEKYPEEVKEIHLGYEDKPYRKPIKRTVRIPKRKIRRESLIKESSFPWIKKFWGRMKN